MKIFIGADHNGYGLKSKLITYLKRAGYSVVDEGDKKFDSDDDFPQFASRVVVSMKGSKDEDPRGILICGSGQGMCMAANRYPGIYASLCWDRKSAKEARTDDNSNVLCLPAYVLDREPEKAKLIVETWLNTPFAKATRFIRRLKQLDELR
jgi:ribose 5-phosphate isomerase B